MAHPLGRRPASRPLPTAALVAALLVGGCAGRANLATDLTLVHTDTAGLSPSAAALLKEAQRSANTRLTGAFAGGLIGVGLGVLAGSQARRGGGGAAAGGAIGAVGGAVLGYAVGAYVDERNRQASGRQLELQSLIQAASKDIDRYEKARGFAQSSIEESGREIDRLNNEYEAGRITTEAYRQEAKNLSTTANSLRLLEKESDGLVLVMQEDVASARRQRQDTSALEAELERLQAENRSLRLQYEELLGVTRRAPQGARQLMAEAAR